MILEIVQQYRLDLMKLDRLHKLKSIHTTTNISKLRPLSPMPNPKYKNPSMPSILLLCTNLACKSVHLERGEITSRIKNINPYSCYFKANEIMNDLVHHEHTRYFTADEFREVRKEFRIK